MNETHDIAELEDSADKVYVIGVHPNTTARFAEIVDDRFASVFDDAEYLVVAGLTTDESVRLHEFDAAAVAEQVDRIRAAETAEEADAAVTDLLEDTDE